MIHYVSIVTFQSFLPLQSQTSTTKAPTNIQHSKKLIKACNKNVCFQVVKYKPSGHYHSHLDSERLLKGQESEECCQYSDWAEGCTLCR